MIYLSVKQKNKTFLFYYYHMNDSNMRRNEKQKENESSFYMLMPMLMYVMYNISWKLWCWFLNGLFQALTWAHDSSIIMFDWKIVAETFHAHTACDNTTVIPLDWNRNTLWTASWLSIRWFALRTADANITIVWKHWIGATIYWSGFYCKTKDLKCIILMI